MFIDGSLREGYGFEEGAEEEVKVIDPEVDLLPEEMTEEGEVDEPRGRALQVARRRHRLLGRYVRIHGCDPA